MSLRISKQLDKIINLLKSFSVKGEFIIEKTLDDNLVGVFEPVPPHKRWEILAGCIAHDNNGGANPSVLQIYHHQLKQPVFSQSEAAATANGYYNIDFMGAQIILEFPHSQIVFVGKGSVTFLIRETYLY